MKISSKIFDKSKIYIKNNLSDQEMEEASKRFLNAKKYYTLAEVLAIEKAKTEALIKH